MNEGKGFSFQFRTKSIQRVSLNSSRVCRFVIEHGSAHWANKEREALIPRRNHLSWEFLPDQYAASGLSLLNHELADVSDAGVDGNQGRLPAIATELTILDATDAK
jgi:hypothetical protein